MGSERRRKRIRGSPNRLGPNCMIRAPKPSTLAQCGPCHSILLTDYIVGAEATDGFSNADLQPILLVFYGEIGSVRSAVKKHKREKTIAAKSAILSPAHCEVTFTTRSSDQALCSATAIADVNDIRKRVTLNFVVQAPFGRVPRCRQSASARKFLLDPCSTCDAGKFGKRHARVF
jgi:hypothetical protein